MGTESGGSQPLTIIQGDDVKAVEKLALVFMNPFHLDIEEGVGVDADLVFPLKVCRELQLVFLQIEESEGSPTALQLQTAYNLSFPSLRPRKTDGRKPMTISFNPCPDADIINRCQRALDDSGCCLAPLTPTSG